MKWFLVALVVAISRFATASEEPSTTSESALLAYGSASYETVEKQRVELGRLNGAAVVADFICSAGPDLSFLSLLTPPSPRKKKKRGAQTGLHSVGPPDLT